MLYIFLLILVALQVGDGVTTFKAIESGKGTEVNPIMKSLIDKLGLIKALILTKGGVSLLFIIVFTNTYSSAQTLTILGMLVLIGIYGWIVKNNLDVIK